MDILNAIPELDDKETSTSISKVTTLEDIQKLHSSLTLCNSLTFKIFLIKRPDLSDEERAIYVKIIDRLEKNDRIRYKDMIDADYGSV